MQANLQFARASDFKVNDRMRLGNNTKVLAGTLTMNAADPPLQFLDCNGVARDVRLPLPSDGQMFVFTNTSAGVFALTIKDSTGVTTYGTVAQSKSAFVFSNGVTWAIWNGA